MTASSDADDDNFAVALGMPAKGEKKSKRGNAVAKKEVVAPHKRKSVAVTVPHKKKRLIQKSSSPTLMTTTMTTTSSRHAKRR